MAAMAKAALPRRALPPDPQPRLPSHLLRPPRLRLRRLVDEFRSLPEPIDRLKRLLAYASTLRPLPEAAWVSSNRIMGCAAQVWVTAALDDLGRMRFAADSDSEITKGFCSCLISVLDGALPKEVLEVRPEDFGDLNVVGMAGRGNSRVNTWQNVLISMQKRTKALIAEAERRPPIEHFPSLVIDADGIQAKGSYAEAQMNSLRSLLRICHQLPDRDNTLRVYEASRFSATTPLWKISCRGWV